MRFRDIIGMSAGNLWRRKTRTILTILGVLIGATSVIVMISLGIGLKYSLMESWNGSGDTNDVTVTYEDQNLSMDKLLTDEKVKEFEELDFAEKVTPQFWSSITLTQGKWSVNTMVIGLSDEEIAKLEIGEGRNLSTEGDNLEFIVGEHLIESVYNNKTYDYPYYDHNEYADVDFLNQVVLTTFIETSYSDAQNGRKHVIPIVGMTTGDEMGVSLNSYCVVANQDALIEYMRKLYRGKVIPGQPTDKNGRPLKDIVYMQIIVKTHSTDEVEAATQYFRDLGYQAQSNLAIMDEINKTFSIVQVVLGGIGAVALLVSAIGIANTMTMSTYERTKEIGVMKVLGCSLSNIRSIFLVEAAFIGMIGGVIGTIFSVIISKMINIFAAPMLAEAMMDIGNIEISRIPVWLMILAIAFSALIGMISGFAPAQRATRLSALEAIRNS